MSFLRFFKALKSKNEIKNEKKMAPEELLSEAKTWQREKKKEVLDKIMSELDEMLRELLPAIHTLENLSLDSFKVEERVKTAVKDNLKVIIFHLNRLYSSLSTLLNKDYESVQEMLKEIESILEDFENRTAKNFQKATTIIGEELAGVRRILASFEKELRKLIKKNQKLLVLEEALAKIKNIEEMIEKKERMREDFSEEVKDIKRRIQQKIAENASLQKEIDRIKESSEYKAVKENKKKLAEKLQEKKSLLLSLKAAIDIKRLANFFHFSPKKMEMIKEIKHNFFSAYEKYGSKPLMQLLSVLDNKEIIENKLKQLEKLEKEVAVLSANLPHKDDIEIIREKQQHNEKERAALEEEEKKLKNKEEAILDEIKELKKQENREFDSLRELI